MKNSEKIILDLCGGTGSWSKSYKDAGYDVRLITLPLFDVTDPYVIEQCVALRPYGILAAPPCTMFSLARTKAETPRDFKEGMATVRACLEIIWFTMEVKQDTKFKTVPLKFWALENPYAMLKFFLGKPAMIFNPYEFGDAYKKKTALWGHFNEPKKLMADLESAKVLKKFDKLKTKEIHGEFYGKLTRTERRAITPQGFAKAFFEANQ